MKTAREHLTALVDCLAGHYSSTPGYTEAIHDARNFLAIPAQTGACICQASPERMQAIADKAGCTLVAYGSNILLDHRCAHHGEKAQPALWGRHKTLELVVTPQQWLSLGVAS